MRLHAAKIVVDQIECLGSLRVGRSLREVCNSQRRGTQLLKAERFAFDVRGVAQRDSADERGPDRDEQKENREDVGESLFVSGEPDAHATIVTFQELNGIQSVPAAVSSLDCRPPKEATR